MKPDPPVRRDNKCPVCLQPRRAPDKKALVANIRQVAAEDPFCSSTCARAWHGCELPPPKYGPPHKKGAA